MRIAALKQPLAPVVWGLVDDRTGHTGQVLGVISKLGLSYAIKRLEYNVYARFPTLMLGAHITHLSSASRTMLAPPYPQLVIAAGRRTLPVLRSIKHRSPTTRTVYLMKPEVTRDLDVWVAPQHDHPKESARLITSVAPLHAVTNETLDAARQAWAPQFAHLPRPYVGLCLGGSSKHGNFSAMQWREIIMRAQAFAANGSLLITTSRRTPKMAVEFCKTMIKNPHFLYAWHEGKDNPYLGILGLSDTLIVTGDSLSMCAEAAVSGVPVFIYAPDALLPKKHLALHQTLYQRSYAKPLDGMARMDWDAPAPLDDAGDVAAEIRRRFPEIG